MNTRQPPITNEHELAGYRAGAYRLREMIDRYEQHVVTERHQRPIDIERLNQIGYHLLHLYGYYHGIQAAIDMYLHHQSA